MDDVYAINVAKSNYREGFNTGDVERVLSVFAPEFTGRSESGTRYRTERYHHVACPPRGLNERWLLICFL